MARPAEKFTDEGLVNLMKASSVANLEGRVARYPRMDKEDHWPA